MALLSDTSMSGMFDPNMLMLAIGSGLLQASGPSPYKEGALGMGLSQGIKNYFAMIPLMQQMKEQQMKQSMINQVLQRMQGGEQPQPQANVDMLTQIPPSLLITPQPQTGSGLEGKVGSWLYNQAFTPVLNKAYEDLKKNLGVSSDMTETSSIPLQYPMLAEAGASDVSPTISQTKTQRQIPATEFAPLLQAIQQGLKQPQQAPAQPQATERKKFPLSLEDVMLLKMIGVDLSDIYKLWQEERKPITVGEGQVLYNPATGEIAMTTPKDGYVYSYDPQAKTWSVKPVEGYLPLKAVEEATKKQIESTYKLTEKWNPKTGGYDFTTEANILRGISEGTSIPSKPTVEEKVEEIRKSEATKGAIEAANKEYNDIIKSSSMASNSDALLSVISQNLNKIAEKGWTGGTVGELKVALTRQVGAMLGDKMNDPFVNALLTTDDIGSMIGLLQGRGGDTALIVGNFNPQEFEFITKKLGVSLRDPVNVMTSKVEVLKEANFRQQLIAQEASKWVSNYGSLANKGAVIRNNRAENITWQQYKNMLLKEREKNWIWLNRIKASIGGR